MKQRISSIVLLLLFFAVQLYSIIPHNQHQHFVNSHTCAQQIEVDFCHTHDHSHDIHPSAPQFACGHLHHHTHDGRCCEFNHRTIPILTSHSNSSHIQVASFILVAQVLCLSRSIVEVNVPMFCPFSDSASSGLPDHIRFRGPPQFS